MTVLAKVFARKETVFAIMVIMEMIVL